MAREQRLSFGEVADLYDKARPSYPGELVQDIIELTPPASPRRALEIGAGTGKATVLFAACGLAVHAVEPSSEMAAIAARRLAGFPDVTIERSDFERFDPLGATFPLIYAAQAWHWVSPEIGYVKVRLLLQAGGLFAAFWNRPRWESCPLRTELAEAYQRAVPELSGDHPMHPGSSSEPEMWDEWERAIEGTHGLDRPEVRGYHWAHHSSTGEYLALLRTLSDNIVLDGARREVLLNEVGGVLDEHGGRLELDYITWLYLARAR